MSSSSSVLLLDSKWDLLESRLNDFSSRSNNRRSSNRRRERRRLSSWKDESSQFELYEQTTERIIMKRLSFNKDETEYDDNNSSDDIDSSSSVDSWSNFGGKNDSLLPLEETVNQFITSITIPTVASKKLDDLSSDSGHGGGIKEPVRKIWKARAA